MTVSWVKNRTFDKTETTEVVVTHQVGMFKAITSWKNNEFMSITIKQMDSTSDFHKTFSTRRSLESLRDVINDALKEAECVPES